MEKDYLKELKYRGLISRIKRLSDSAMASGRKLYNHIDIGIEPNWYLIFEILNEREQSSVSEISSILNFSHPSVITIIKKMDEAGYLNITAHKTDGRKQIIKLSKKARNQLPEMQTVWDACESSVASIFSDDNFLKELDKLEKAFEKKSFFTRVVNHLDEKEIEVRPFTKADSIFFKELNEEWLIKYFEIEPIDVLVLNNPVEQIINRKGLILMADFHNEVIGTTALLPKNDNEIELCRMAVNSNFQGKGAGKKLLLHAIETAKKMSYKTLILYSNTKLIPAIKLYEKFGFEEVKLESDVSYGRANIKMKLALV